MNKKHPDYTPNPIFTDAFPEISGNTVNGLGETEYRQASPFFWHSHDRQTHGLLQETVINYHRRSPEMREVLHPRLTGAPSQLELRMQRSASPLKSGPSWLNSLCWKTRVIWWALRP